MALEIHGWHARDGPDLALEDTDAPRRHDAGITLIGELDLASAGDRERELRSLQRAEPLVEDT